MRFRLYGIAFLLILFAVIVWSVRAHASDPDKKLSKVIRDSKLSVVGKVEDLSPYGRHSSQNSEWYIVTIKVKEVIHCSYPDCKEVLYESSQQIQMLVTNSDDQEPVLKTGQESIFIMVDSRDKLRNTIFTLSSRVQIQPLENIEKVKNLIRESA